MVPSQTQPESRRARSLSGLWRRPVASVLLITSLSGCWSGATGESHSAATGKTKSGRIGKTRAGPGLERDGPPPAIQFVDVTNATGVDFQYRDGQEAGHWTMLESLGGGLAAFDYDLDGDADLFCVGGGRFGPGREIRGENAALFRNESNWRFVDVTRPAAVLTTAYYGHAVSTSDFDDDGFTDLLITGYGGLQLFRNQGDGTFGEVAEAAGLTDRLWSSGAGWGDVNGDGSPDLYVAHYVDWSWENHPYCAASVPNQRDLCAPKDFGPLPDTLYLSNGDGTFRDASQEAGLRGDGKGLGALVADLDLDGRLDVYVTNDGTPNFLYRNIGNGRFEEIGLPSGTALGDRGDPDGSMGVDLGDFDLDGRFDLWVANYEGESFALYRNDGNGLYRHISRFAGVMAVGGLFVGWGTCFFDVDRDGDEDVFVTNGHVIRFPTRSSLRQLPLLFENHRGERLVNVAPHSGRCLSVPRLGRGAVYSDFDGDGDLDLVQSPINEPVAFFSNESANDKHWMSLRLIGTRSSRDPVGSVVSIRTAFSRQVRQVKTGASYASSHDPRLFFGLGDDQTVDHLEIRWPSGTVQEFVGMPADRSLLVIEGRDAVF